MNNQEDKRRPIIRISKVSLHNFMNVENGEITFPDPQTEEGLNKASIVGLYGQNGSGKSALVRSLAILKSLCGEGKTIGNLKGSNLIRSGCSFADFKYDFSLQYPNGDSFSATYSLSLSSDVFEDTTLVEIETLKCKGVVNGEKINSHIVFDSSWDLYERLREESKRETNENSSIIFNPSCFSTVQSYLSKKKNEYDYIVLKDLYDFISTRLYIVESSRIADLGLGEIILGIGDRIVSLEYDNISNVGNLHSIGFSDEEIKTCIDKLSNVFQVIVPGVRIKLGDERSPRILVSERDGFTIPFIQESYGIRKIFGIIQHLVNVYNMESYTVVIDEFDEGIFEYLLGQLLEIIREGGQGQLLFTSHNLRPLEVLNKENIYFTTANATNRYIRMISIKPHNNLRDTYFRAIQLGGQKEELYNETEEDDIETAFIVAGEHGYGN